MDDNTELPSFSHSNNPKYISQFERGGGLLKEEAFIVAFMLALWYSTLNENMYNLKDDMQ